MLLLLLQVSYHDSGARGQQREASGQQHLPFLQ